MVDLDNYLLGPESSLPLGLEAQPILDYSETVSSLWFSAAFISLHKRVKRSEMKF